MQSVKRPSVKGPSGALASLGFARGQSLESFGDEEALVKSKNYGSGDGNGNGSLYDGGSEAGSRFESEGQAEVRDVIIYEKARLG